MWFENEWFRENGVNASNCQVISVIGDSMDPVLPDGCRVLLDLGNRELHDGRIYAVRIGDVLVVKRAVVGAGGWSLVSENPAWEPVPLGEGAQVIGRVRCTVVTM